jgi:hypothetical protein
MSFFAGRSHGSGTLKVIASGAIPIAVESVGKRHGDALVLQQVIHEGSKPPRTREWRIRKLGPNSFGGALTDASGPVDMQVRGPRALIRYRMKNGMVVHQQLALQVDESTVLNHLEVKKWGIRVASLDETIRKLD